MTKYLRFASGAVYRYSESLAAREDAVEVPERDFALHLASMGVDNDLTRKHKNPAPAIPEELPQPKKKLTVSKAGRGKKTMVVADSDKEALKELLGDVEDLL